MAQTLTRTTKQLNPSVNVYYTDVWTDPAARTPDASFNYSYNDLAPTLAKPTDSACLDSFGGASNWKAKCRIVINYVTHIQPLWDLKRPVMTIGTASSDHCSGCHSTLDAAMTVQVPAGQLNLTSAASDEEPLQPFSYRHLLFPHAKQEVIMGALQPVPGPPDADGNPTAVLVGPYMNAGSANGSQSAAALGRFAAGSGSTHAGYLSPAELRLISEWLDIGAQFFNNPFDQLAPVN
jgi:hypothetical protein